MYRLLEPIKITNSYELKKSKLLPTDLNVIMEFLKKDNMTVEKLISFLKYHINYIYDMIRYVPIQILLNAYLDYNFLLNYMSNELYDYILKKSDSRFKIKLYLNEDVIPDLICLNDCFNEFYNFSDTFVLKKLNKVKTELNFIEWDKYYIGSDLILSLASRKPINIKTIIFTLYPKIKMTKFNPGTYFRDEDNNYVCTYSNYIVIIDRFSYCNFGEVLLEKDTIVVDNDKIYCTFKSYQKLVSINRQVKELLTLLKPLIGLSANFKTYKRKHKYKHQNLNINYCYVCKKYFDNELTYDRYIDMCLDCGKFNYDKRIKMADLTGKTAFVTGIRQKIGLQIALKLLRCGAKVIGTTRFINATYYNYMKQPDFEKWKDNLIICQCDFLNLSGVMKLIGFLKTQNINIFINNACQTIRASSYYYEQLGLLEKSIDNLIQNNLIQYWSLSDNKLICPYQNNNQQLQVIQYVPTINSQLTIINEKLTSLNIKFNQFNDIKDKNIKEQSSWQQNIQDIDPSEILEATIINQTVPTLFINQLKSTMVGPKFIIHVTALEGTFNTSKISTHAHTNMCKAAMNMLIRTIFEENEKDQYVYSINPGLVSSVNPQHDHYPLSDEDGATRILYPIIEFYNGAPLDKEWIHLRNYLPEKW